MTWISKVPAGCEHLDLALVERALAKHFGDIPRAEKELGVSGPDLNRLTWAKPKLLEEAEDRRGEVIARAWGQLITALYSDDPDRQMWASDKILSSWLARNHPLAPARRGRAPPRQVVFRWDGGDPATDALERDGQTLAVPRYSITPLASSFIAAFTQVAGTVRAAAIGGEPIPTLGPASTASAVASGSGAGTGVSVSVVVAATVSGRMALRTSCSSSASMSRPLVQSLQI